MKKLSNRELLVSTKADLEALSALMEKRERAYRAFFGETKFAVALYQDRLWMDRLVERLGRHVK